ncbi:hypothetical protein [Aeromicrobium sp.]|uniref:hypothetical protein n=1 Tax=Aeromicrobium sp. TaxID=1871063 RepID=UPI004033932D
MEFSDYRHVLRQQWKAVTACLAVAVIVAGLLIAFLPRQYQSTTELVAGNPSSPQSAPGGPATTYAGVIASDTVVRAVIDELDLGVTPREFRENVSISRVPDANLIRVAITASSPDAARTIAQTYGTIAANFARAVAQTRGVGVVDLDNPPPSSGETPPLRVVQAADDPEAPESPKPVVVAMLCLLAGLAAGAAVAVARFVRQAHLQEISDVVDVLPDSASVLAEVDPAELPGSESSFRRAAVALDQLPLGRRVVLLTGAGPEQVDSSAESLARSLAARGGDVVVVDTAGALTGRLGITERPGLGELLARRIAFDSAIERLAPRLSILPLGSDATDISPALVQPSMRGILDTLAERHDVVLVVARADEGSSDAEVLSVLCGATIVVVALGEASRPRLVARLGTLTSVGVEQLMVLVVRQPGRRRRREASSDASREVTPPAPGPDHSERTSNDLTPVQAGQEREARDVGAARSRSRRAARRADR